MAEERKRKKAVTRTEQLTRWSPSEYKNYIPTRKDPVLRLIEDPFASIILSTTLSQVLKRQQATDALLIKHRRYRQSLPIQQQRAIAYLIKSNRGVTAYRTYWHALTTHRPWLKDKPAEFKKQLAELESRNKSVVQFISDVQTAILNAPRSGKPLTLFHGQGDMIPFTFQGYPASYNLSTGDVAVLPSFISSDNNVALAIFGRSKSGNGGYWSHDDQCCLWRINVPRGFPLFFVEGLDHVLLPAGTIMRVTGKRLIKIPSTSQGFGPDDSITPLLMYDMDVVGLAKNEILDSSLGRIVRKTSGLSRLEH